MGIVSDKKNGSGLLPSDVETKLERLAQNQSKWRNERGLEDKLALLQEIHTNLTKTITMDDWYALGEWTAGTMMGIPTHTDEGACVKTAESVIPLLFLKEHLERLMESYKMASGGKNISANAKVYAEKLQPKLATNGQVIYDVFPLLAKDTFGPNAGVNVQWWLDPDRVKTLQDAPKPFVVDEFADKESKEQRDGVLVVLGAGNQSFLTIMDVIEGLFTKQRTVLLKHHPLRGVGLEPILRKLFQPLYEQGYLESIMDLDSVEANSALVYHPMVTAIHMTGGKPTHDAIV